MKLSKLWLTLILIACALLVNGASESANAPTSKSPASGNEQGERADTKKADTQQPQTQSIPGIVAINNPPTQKEETGPKEESAYWPPIWSNWALVIATIVLGIVALRTLDAIRRQSDATDKAAQASFESAKVAGLALKTDRPYLVIEQGEIFGILTPEVTSGRSKISEIEHFVPSATFTFRNFGKGPALLEGAIIRLFPLVEIPKAGDFTECKAADTSGAEAIGAEEPLKVRIKAVEDRMINESDYKDIIKGTKTLFVWGRVQYKDVVGETLYETAFCWKVEPPFEAYGHDKITRRIFGSFVQGPKTHNYYKESLLSKLAGFQVSSR